MKKKILIVLSVIVLIILILGTLYLIDRKRMKDNKPVVFSTWGYSYVPPVKVEEYNYSKTIDEILIELDIPNEWTFEEDLASSEYNNFYKFALKIYKNSPDKNITLYFYNGPFGVCGTGRRDEIIKLNNGKTATIGYYDNNEEWCDISFYELNPKFAFINNGIDGNDAKEALEFIKTINISTLPNTNDIEEYEFIGEIIKTGETYIIVKPDANSNEIKSCDKISINIIRPTDGTNDFYVVGNKVRITYNGVILESYPAQVKAIKIELAS